MSTFLSKMQREHRIKSFNIINPIQNSDLSGMFKTSVTSIEKYKSKLYTLLFTNVGERVMLPTYGINLRRLLFEPIDDNNIQNIRNEVKNAVLFWIPEIEILNINVIKQEENNGITFTIKFGLKFDPDVEDLIELEFKV